MKRISVPTASGWSEYAADSRRSPHSAGRPSNNYRKETGAPPRRTPSFPLFCVWPPRGWGGDWQGESGVAKPETGVAQPENRKPETGNRKPETGNRKPETRTDRSDVKN